MRLLRRVRPVEWAVVIYGVFFAIWNHDASPLAVSDLVSGRSAGILTALGLVACAQGLWRFSRTPWHPAAPRPLVWLLLPLALLPWAFALTQGLSSGLFARSDTALAAHAITAVTAVLLTASALGLPTVLIWLLWAQQARELGAATLPRTRARLASAAGVLRDWLPMLFAITAYATQRFHVTRDYDAELLQADRWLFGGRDPQDLLAPFINRFASEELAFVYTFYGVLYPLVLGTIFVTGGRPALQRGAFALSLSLLLAYVSYQLVPVKGPVLTREFEVPLDLYLIAPIKEALMDQTRVAWDCFPSMHTCCTLLLAEAAWVWARRLFWLLTPIVVQMPLACVYLRYHYVTDIVAGVLLAAAIIALTRWHFARHPNGYA